MFTLLMEVSRLVQWNLEISLWVVTKNGVKVWYRGFLQLVPFFPSLSLLLTFQHREKTRERTFKKERNNNKKGNEMKANDEKAFENEVIRLLMIIFLSFFFVRFNSTNRNWQVRLNI